MNPILERLRQEEQLAKNGNHPILERSFRLAIDEIERLEAERLSEKARATPEKIGMLNAEIRTLRNAAVTQAEEIDRLRAALTDIASMADEEDEWDGRDRFHRARDFAKRAIDQQKAGKS